MARAGTPTHIVHKISQDLQSVLKEPAVVERFAKLGVYPRLASPAETAEFIRSEREALKPIIKDAGLGMQ
jgi:tripartite-type tricarboxylate transporter receptor subunit TctC